MKAWPAERYPPGRADGPGWRGKSVFRFLRTDFFCDPDGFREFSGTRQASARDVQGLNVIGITGEDPVADFRRLRESSLVDAPDRLRDFSGSVGSVRSGIQTGTLSSFSAFGIPMTLAATRQPEGCFFMNYAYYDREVSLELAATQDE